MKRLFAVLLFLLAFSMPVLAQNATCPDVTPSSDSSNRCANTRFVHSVAGSATPGGTNGQVQYNNAGAFGGLTNPQLTALCQQFTSTLSGCVPLSGGGTTNFLRADGVWAAPSASCPIGYFCVSNYATVADAFTAATSAGGGTVYFTQSVNLSAAQVVSNNIDVLCSNKGIIIGTTSTTADLFQISGTRTSISNCKLAFTGAGTKTSGALVLQTGDTVWLNDLRVAGGCYVCFNLNGLVTYMTNIDISGNVTETVAATSAAIIVGIGAQITHLSNISLSPSAAGHFYEFGLDVQGSAVDAVNMELIQANFVVNMQGDGFLTMSNGYLDNCGVQCLRVAPPAGHTIGQVTLSNMHIGLNTSGAVINIDNTGGGNIAEVSISNSSIFNYSAGSGNCVSLSGSLSNITIVGNLVVSCATALLINGGTTGGITVMSNLLQGSPNGIVATPVNTNMLIQYNRLGGSTQNCGANAAANCGNNLP